MEDYKLTKFNNGLRVLTVASKESLSFQVVVFVNTGFDFENKKENGLSHFLEHLCFKGTEKRRSNFEITKELDSLGGIYNATTSSECTYYWVRLSKEHKEKALDVVSDIYLNSQFPEAELEKEKKVVMEEINMHQDDPKLYVWELWPKLLYGDQPIGRFGLGTKENIKNFSRKDVMNYYRSQYKAKSTLVAISGNFSDKEAIQQVKKYFSSIPLGQGRRKENIKEKQTKPALLVKEKETGQTHFVLGFRGISLKDKRRYALDLLDAIFDGGMSGMLFQLVREKLGAAYYVRSYIEYFTDHGFWVVNAGVDNSRLEMIIKSILQEWEKLKTSKISSADLNKAKNYIAGRFALSQESVHNRADYLASWEILSGKIETPREYLKKIKAVTLGDLKKTAGEIINKRSLNLALIGSIKEKRTLLKILNNY